MSKKHGARQQKKLAKQKARRTEKRAHLARRTSTDPTVRLQGAERWPVVRAAIADDLWAQGLGEVLVARQGPGGQVASGVYLVDVWCLGVKNAFWGAGTEAELRTLVRRIEERHSLVPIDPACLVKLVQGAVDYAAGFGFRPHPDFQRASLLLGGIDPETCSREFTYGKDGKPFYMRGPNESHAEAEAITRRVVEAGGHFLVGGPDLGLGLSGSFGDRMIEEDEDDEDEDRPDEPD